MTIIQLNKNDSRIKLTAFSLMAALTVATVWGIFLYNNLVNLRHEADQREKIFRAAEVNNAELKNDLYRLIDAQNLEILIKDQSFILDKNPQYVANKPLAANR